tara:strand:+ start:1843 stop:4050 length:2208 start_codon:yes stop_codon:yes gene_type:complete
MAHGYLTPTKVGDKDIFRTIGDLLDRFKKEGNKNGAPPEGGSELAVVQKAGKTKVYKEARTSNEKEQKNVNLLVTRMGGVLSNMISRGGSTGEQSIGGTKKGGSFVNMGASTKPISDTTFFKSAVVEGVNPLTGEYYSPEERIAAFKKYRPKERTTQGVGVSGGAAADIVAALAKNTAAVIRMEEAVREQTGNDTKIASKDLNEREKILNRLLASQEERNLEGGGDLSGNMRPDPVGGTGAGYVGRRGNGVDLGDIARRGFKPALKGTKATVSTAKMLVGTKKTAGTLTKAGNIAIKGSSMTRPVTKGMVNMATKLPGTNAVFNLFRGSEKFMDPKTGRMITKTFGTGAKGIKATKTFVKTAVTAGNQIAGPVSTIVEPLTKITGDHVGSLSTVAKSGSKTKKFVDAGTVIAGGSKDGIELVTKSGDMMDNAKKAAVATDGVSTAKTLASAADAGAKPSMLKRFIFGTKPKGLVRGSKLTRMLIKNPAGKMFLKKLPLIGAIAGTIFAAQRLLEGDFLGAGLELGSGILGAVGAAPASLALDGFLLARDFGAVPFKKGGITTQPTFGMMSENRQKEGVLSLEGNEGVIAGTVFGKASAEALANFFQKKKSPLEKLRYNSDHPMGTEQPNPHPPGTFLHKNFERLRQMNIIDPTMKISHNFTPSGVNNGASLANSSAEVASGDRKNNSGNNTVIMESPAGTDNKGNSGLPLTSNPSGGSEDQGLNMYAAHLVMASV